MLTLTPDLDFVNARIWDDTPFVELVLAFQIFKRFMITMDHKLFRKKIMLPSIQSSNKGI